jgi:hypothetical protein
MSSQGTIGSRSCLLRGIGLTIWSSSRGCRIVHLRRRAHREIYFLFKEIRGTIAHFGISSRFHAANGVVPNCIGMDWFDRRARLAYRAPASQQAGSSTDSRRPRRPRAGFALVCVRDWVATSSNPMEAAGSGVSSPNPLREQRLKNPQSEQQQVDPQTRSSRQRGTANRGTRADSSPCTHSPS